MVGIWFDIPGARDRNVFTRTGIPFHQVTGVLDDYNNWQEIEEWLAATRVFSAISEARLGLMGHYYSGMLDIMTDITQLSIAYGSHVELVEVDELSALCADVSEIAIEARVEQSHKVFDVQPDCPEDELRRAACTSAVLDPFIVRHNLDGLANYYKGSGNAANEDTMSSIILGTSLLNAPHVPVEGEYEVKNAIAIKMMDTLGAGGSFTEYYAINYDNDVVLMGHDGPGHIAIAEGKTKVRPLRVYHCRVGRGLSVEMRVKCGPVTVLSVVEDSITRFKLITAEGEFVTGETLEIGNINSRYGCSRIRRSMERPGARTPLRDWCGAFGPGPEKSCSVNGSRFLPSLLTDRLYQP